MSVVLIAGLALGCNAKRLDLFQTAQTVGADPQLEERSSNGGAPNASPTVALSASSVPSRAEPDAPDPGTPEPETGLASNSQDAGLPTPSGVPTGGASSPGPSPPLDADTMASSRDAGFAPAVIPIDDFEDGDTQAIASSGWWYVTTDTSPGVQRLEATAPTARAGSQYALRVSGSAYTDWGVILGLDLRGEMGFFDATPTTAVRFWARSGTERTFILRLLEQDGGSHTTQVALSTVWTELVVPFSDFEAAGDAGAVDTTRIGHLQLYFDIEPFEVWLDDVAFVTLSDAEP